MVNSIFGLMLKLLRQYLTGEMILLKRAKVRVETKSFNYRDYELPRSCLRGEFFGEMALFSGEPSPVSIVAVDDLQVLVIYSDAVNTMIERQPSLGRGMGQIIEARSKAVSMARQAD